MIRVFALLLATALFAQPVDFLCTEVLRLYPLEFFDSSDWWQLCQNTSNPEELLSELKDPLARVFEEPEASLVEYSQYETSTVGYLLITGFQGGQELIAQFDAELEKARYDEGLILDLRGAGGGEIETACQILARLTNAPLPGVKIKTRVQGTEEYKEKSFYIKPRGDWQFELPLVMLVDANTYWPAQVLLYAATDRPQMETVGYPSMGTKAVEPIEIGLPDVGHAQIPTAMAWTPANVKLTGQPFEPNVNLNHDPANTYRDPKDPILWRGANEVFRMMGRLEWLQEEQRKRLLDDESRHKKIETH